MEKIALVMTALNPNEFKINRALQSAVGFDSYNIHIDSDTKKPPILDIMGDLRYFPFHFKDHMGIGEAYDKIIGLVDDDWICCFCDDDFFDPKGLANLLASIRAGNHTADDIIHFKVHISGNKPYHQWGAAVPGNLEQANCLPAGSFFRKSVWQKAGGFRGVIWHDWVLWLRALRTGAKFRFFDDSVYWFMMRPGSAAERQLAAFDGSFEKARERVLEDARIV